LGGLYKFIEKEERREDNVLTVLFAVTAAAFITLFIVFYFYKEAVYAMDLIFYAWLCSLVLISFSRSIIWMVFKKQLQGGMPVGDRK
jgi:FlaA1/EpsC-like NDP-sugar epimerase